MRILALDMATKTGWASLSESGRESGTQDFSARRGESHGMIYVRFRAWLQDIIALVRPQVVVYEMPHLRGGPAATLLAGLETRVHELHAVQPAGLNPWLWEYTKVHGMTVKKLVLGSGKADKAASKAWAARQLGRPPADDNEADALAILEWARREYAGREVHP